MSGVWSFYFPDDECRDNAVPIIGKIFDADHAAKEACEYDFQNRGGWERGECEFTIAVISPEGEEIMFIGWHEPTVDHMVRESVVDV